MLTLGNANSSDSDSDDGQGLSIGHSNPQPILSDSEEDSLPISPAQDEHDLIFDIEAGHHLRRLETFYGGLPPEQDFADDDISDDESPAPQPERPTYPAPNQLYPKQWIDHLHFYLQHIQRRVESLPHQNRIDLEYAIHGIFMRVHRMPALTIGGRRKVCAGVFQAYPSIIADSMAKREPKIRGLRKCLCAPVNWAWDGMTRMVQRHPWRAEILHILLTGITISVLLLEQPWYDGLWGEVHNVINSTFSEQGEARVNDLTDGFTDLQNKAVVSDVKQYGIGWLALGSILIYLWQKRPTLEHGRPTQVDDPDSDDIGDQYAIRTLHFDDYKQPWVRRPNSRERFVYLSLSNLSQQYHVDMQEVIASREEPDPKNPILIEHADLPLQSMLHEFPIDSPFTEPLQVLRRFLWSHLDLEGQSYVESAHAIANAFSRFLAAIPQIPQDCYIRGNGLDQIYQLFRGQPLPIGQEAIPQLIAQLRGIAKVSSDDDEFSLLAPARGVAEALANMLVVVNANDIGGIPDVPQAQVNESSGISALLSAAVARLQVALGNMNAAAEQAQAQQGANPAGFFAPPPRPPREDSPLLGSQSGPKQT